MRVLPGLDCGAAHPDRALIYTGSMDGFLPLGNILVSFPSSYLLGLLAYSRVPLAVTRDSVSLPCHFAT